MLYKTFLEDREEKANGSEIAVDIALDPRTGKRWWREGERDAKTL